MPEEFEEFGLSQALGASEVFMGTTLDVHAEVKVKSPPLRPHPHVTGTGRPPHCPPTHARLPDHRPARAPSVHRHRGRPRPGVEVDGDPEIMRYLTGGHPRTREEIRAESFERMPPDGFWATQLRATGAFLGWHCLSPVEDSPIEARQVMARQVKNGQVMARRVKGNLIRDSPVSSAGRSGLPAARGRLGQGARHRGRARPRPEGLGELGYDRIVADTMFVNARSPAPNSPPCHTH